MALSEINGSLFRGIKSLTLYDRDTEIPSAFLRVISEVNIDYKVDFDDLDIGGTIWDSEQKSKSAELSFTAYDYTDEMVEQLTGGTMTEYESEADGEIVDFANVKGTSVFNATTGIASISVTALEKADLKEGKYTIVASGGNTARVYAASDISFGDGKNTAFIDNSLVITAALEFASATGTKVDDYGITLNGGSGTIAFTPGDTASFYVRRPLVTGYKLKVGGINDTVTECGVWIYPKKKNTYYTMIDCFKVKIAGMPIGFKDGYSEYKVTAKLLYDSAKDGYYNLIKNG
jgi:hypothetical protein